MIVEKIESQTDQQNESTFFSQSKIEQIKKAELIIRAVKQKERQDILNLLSKEMSVTEIRLKLRLEQSTVSQHLGTLRDAKLVKKKRVGKRSIYIRNEDTFRKVAFSIKGLALLVNEGENSF